MKKIVGFRIRGFLALAVAVCMVISVWALPTDSRAGGCGSKPSSKAWTDEQEAAELERRKARDRAERKQLIDEFMVRMAAENLAGRCAQARVEHVQLGSFRESAPAAPGANWLDASPGRAHRRLSALHCAVEGLRKDPDGGPDSCRSTSAAQQRSDGEVQQAVSPAVLRVVAPSEMRASEPRRLARDVTDSDSDSDLDKRRDYSRG